MNPPREFLNQHRWHHDDLSELVVLVVHRGAPGDQRRVLGEAIADITGDGFTVAADDEAEDVVFIPFHRVLRVLRGGVTLWPASAEPAGSS